MAIMRVLTRIAVAKFLAQIQGNQEAAKGTVLYAVRIYCLPQ